MSSRKRSKEFLVNLWRKNYHSRRDTSGCSLESQCLISDAFVHKNAGKIKPYLGGISTFGKSCVSSGCKVIREGQSTFERLGFLSSLIAHRNDHPQKQRDQEVMDSLKALFESSEEEDQSDELVESDSQAEVSAVPLNQTDSKTDGDILEEHRSQMKYEEPSDCLQDDDDLLIPLNFFKETFDSPTSVKTNNKSEGKKTKKQKMREKEKMKKRKLAYSGSELEDETENATSTIDYSSTSLKKDKRKKGKERKKRKKKTDENESEDNSDHEPSPKKLRPNYFVAVRVSNPAIHTSVKLIQDSMVDYDKLLQPALIPISTLHITLMVMHLQPEEVDKAFEVLKTCESDFKDLFDDTLPMTFDELAHFRNEVVFGKMNNDEEVEKLKLLATVVRNNYEKHGFPTTDDRPFTPHLTIMKLSRMQTKKKKRVKKIPPESYSSWLDCELGKEMVNEVLLCSMNHKKDKEGFYHCVGSVCVSDSTEDVQETTEPSQD